MRVASESRTFHAVRCAGSAAGRLAERVAAGRSGPSSAPRPAGHQPPARHAALQSGVERRAVQPRLPATGSPLSAPHRGPSPRSSPPPSVPFRERAEGCVPPNPDPDAARRSEAEGLHQPLLPRRRGRPPAPRSAPGRCRASFSRKSWSSWKMPAELESSMRTPHRLLLAGLEVHRLDGGGGDGVDARGARGERDARAALGHVERVGDAHDPRLQRQRLAAGAVRDDGVQHLASAGWWRWARRRAPPAAAAPCRCAMKSEKPSCSARWMDMPTSCSRAARHHHHLRVLHPQLVVLPPAPAPRRGR